MMTRIGTAGTFLAAALFGAAGLAAAQETSLREDAARPSLASLPSLPAIVVVLAPGASVPDALARRGEHLGGRSFRLPSARPLADAREWAARPDVRAADPDYVLPRRRADFDDPQYGGQWYLEELGMEGLFAVSLGSAAIRVAVLDSAIDIAHPDLAAGIDGAWDSIEEDDDPSPRPGEYCAPGVEEICDDHGTAVAGIVAARANNAVGIVGLCADCTLVPIRLLADYGTPLSADVRSFEHAIAEDVAVINNSWGFIDSIPAPDTLAEVIHRAATETRGGLGSLVVFAAGNDDREIFDDEVQALPDVLCVGAVDSYGNPTAFTNFGASVDLAAPSATVTLAPGGGTTTTFGGTSAAAPVASGIAAWAASVDPSLSAAELADLIVSTARPSPLVTPDENGHHDVYGYGLLDAQAILARLVPPAEPDAGPGVDAGADAGASDAGTDAAAEDGGDGPGGCGCRAGGSAGASGGLLGIAVLVVARRRRRGSP